jgi:hypothetical protein
MISGGKGRMPGASCDSGQALEKAQNGKGQLLEKVGMDLGLAPRRLGFGATPVWGWRRPGLGLAPRRLGIDGTMPTVNAIRAVLDLPILQALFAIRRPLRNIESVHANSRREPTANAISAVIALMANRVGLS